MRRNFSSLIGFLCIFVLIFAVTACDDEGSSSGEFWFDASLPTIDAALPDGSPGDAGPPPETTFTSTPAALSKEAIAKFEFVSSQPGGTFACQLDEQAPAECVSPHMAPVAEGVHTFKVSAVSALSATAVDLTPATFTWTVDLTAPKTTITKSPPAVDNTKSAKLEFTVSEPGTTTCAVDANAAAPCTSPFTTGDLADGQHTVSVVATDLAGNVETPAKTHTWTLDTTTPDTTIESGPPQSVSAKTATFTFSSTAGSGATFQCSLDAAAFATCASPFALSGLAEGDHTFRVRGSDAAHNQDITPAERSWTVDTIAPTVTITGGPTGSTNNATPTFPFTTAGATATQCRFDATAFAPCTSPLTPGAALGQGAHTFEVQATDAAGNAANATQGFTVDTVNPSVAITSGPNGPTNDNTTVFTFTTAAGATGTECRIDTAAFAACTSPFTSATLLDGAHTLDVRAADAAGNVATASQSFTVDTIAPTVTITGGPNGPTRDTTPTFDFTTVSASSTECRFDGGTFASCLSPFTPAALAEGAHTFEVRAIDVASNASTATRGFTIDTTVPSITINSGPTGPTNGPTPTFTFTAAAGAINTQCRIDAAAFADCTSPFTSTPLADAAHTFDVHAFDAAGNVATAERGFTVDTVAPAVLITDGPNGPTNVATPQLTFTVTGTATTVECRINTGAFAACTSPFTAPPLAQGPYTFEVRAVDAATNANAATRTFTVDTTLPSIAINTGPSGPTNDNAPQFTFASGLGAVVMRCRIDDAAFVDCTSPFTSATLTDAAHTFDVHAFDAAGNIATASRSFTVDTAAPTVTITGGPSGPTKDTTPEFTFTTIGATSTSCSINGAAFSSCTSPFTTAVLAEGAYTLEVHAVDAATNSATTAPRAFAIDTSAPTININGGPSGPTKDTTLLFTFAGGAGTTTLRCRVDAAAFAPCTSPLTTAVLADGAHKFEVEATDAAGNSATDSREFTVDTAAPVVTITQPPSNPTTDSTPTVQFTVTGATTIACAVDLGGFAPCTSPFTPATPLSDGSHTIHVRGVDAATNSDTKSATFTVDTKPVVTITSGPSGLTKDNFPTFEFTVTGGAVLVECSLDGKSFTKCSGTYKPADKIADGSYTFTVRALDDLDNSVTASRSFIVDATPPAVNVISGPGEAPYDSVATFTISADADAKTECRWFYPKDGSSTPSVPCSPSRVNMTAPTVAPGMWEFQVVATDAAGNSDTATWNVSVYDPR